MSASTLDITTAATLLSEGGVVAIPTETVYGLAGSIASEHAIKKIFTLKQRPTCHPLIIHLADVDTLTYYAQSIPPYVETLLKHFCPGPLTLVLKRTSAVSPLVTGGQDTVGIRFPAHPMTQALIKKIGHALAAPSANRFGRISPTLPLHVYAEFGDEVKILAGGQCEVGIESTIVDATSFEQCTILRQGIVSHEQIQKVLGQAVEVLNEPLKRIIRVSGDLKKHYAPSKPTFLFSTLKELEALTHRFHELSILCLSNAFLTPNGTLLPSNPHAYARQIYHALRNADEATSKAIAIERPPLTPEWVALHDRLNRASQH